MKFLFQSDRLSFSRRLRSYVTSMND